MGVPYFFSWLIQRYPLALQTLQPGEEPIVDNVYIDMNGIIYQFAKDEKAFFKDLLSEKNFDDLFISIFNFLNLIIKTVDPKKLVMIALDGPAPRAKLNQQRSRRFQTETKNQNLIKLLQEFKLKQPDQQFRNNSISPGTEFMDDLNEQLKFFIQKKFEEDIGFKHLQIILSGSNVPGEGEHKIISFIKQQIQQQNYDPNTSHAIYGADADLIMLSLQLHLQNLIIVRQIMNFRSLFSKKQTSRSYQDPQFQIIHTNILREYFELEYSALKKDMQKLNYDIERIIDDFIFIAFFVGNDFLPRLYCFDIRQGEYDELLEEYKNYLLTAESYICDNGKVNWKSFTIFLEKLINLEQEFVNQRAEEINHQIKKMKTFEKKKSKFTNTFAPLDQDQSQQKQGQQVQTEKQTQGKATQEQNVQEEVVNDDLCDDNDQELEELEDMKNEVTFQTKTTQLEKQGQFINQVNEQYKQQKPDNAKKIYYETKLKINYSSNTYQAEIDKIVSEYLAGLQFILNYYYFGIPSWSWYYSYYYSPMISDIYNYLKEGKLQEQKFQIDEPFNPVKQLLCILHPGNAALLPKPYQFLLTDKNSILRSPIDYYTDIYEIDPFGAIWEHQYIVKIPFLDMQIIEKAFKSVDQTNMTEAEKKRIQLGKNLSFKYNTEKGNQQIQTVKSLLPDFYSDFTVSVKIEEILIQDQQQFITKYIPSKEMVMPSLHSKKIVSNFLVDSGNRAGNKTLCIQIDDNEFEQSEIDPQQDYYCNYPYMRKCQIVAEINEQQYSTYGKKHIFFDQYYNKSLKKQGFDHEHIFHQLQEEIEGNCYQQGIDEGQVFDEGFRIVIVQMSIGLKRSLDGTIGENKSLFQEQAVPLFLLSKSNNIKPKFVLKNYTSVSEEFPNNTPVVTLNPENWGDYGRVMGTQKGQVQVNTSIQPLMLDNLEYHKFIQNDEKFFTLDYVQIQLQTTSEVVLQLIASVSVEISHNKYESDLLPDMIDIGLNVINLKKKMLIPELVRIQQDKLQAYFEQKSEQFQYVEFSHKLLDILMQYKQKFPEVFEILEKKDLHEGFKIQIERLFKKEKLDQAIFKLIQIYSWRITLDISSLTFQPVSSKVLNLKQINELEKTLLEKSKRNKCFAQIIKCDPNFVCRYWPDKFVPMYFQEFPGFHDVGDRVITLNAVRTGNLLFGRIGTITGILGNKYEVVFDKPFIGGSKLGGRCQNLHGAIVNFIDIFNLEYWQKKLQHRDVKTRDWGWDLVISYPQISFGYDAINQVEQAPDRSKEKKSKDRVQSKGSEKQQQKPKQKEDQNKEQKKENDENKFIQQIEQTENMQEQYLKETLGITVASQNEPKAESDNKDNLQEKSSSSTDQTKHEVISSQQQQSKKEEEIKQQQSEKATIEDQFKFITEQSKKQSEQKGQNSEKNKIQEKFLQITNKLVPGEAKQLSEQQIEQKKVLSLQELEILQQQKEANYPSLQIQNTNNNNQTKPSQPKPSEQQQKISQQFLNLQSQIEGKNQSQQVNQSAESQNSKQNEKQFLEKIQDIESKISNNNPNIQNQQKKSTNDNKDKQQKRRQKYYQKNKGPDNVQQTAQNSYFQPQFYGFYPAQQVIYQQVLQSPNTVQLFQQLQPRQTDSHSEQLLKELQPKEIPRQQAQAGNQMILNLQMQIEQQQQQMQPQTQQQQQQQQQQKSEEKKEITNQNQNQNQTKQ